MIELQNKDLKNHKFNIEGENVSSDENGVIKVASQAVAAALLVAGFKPTKAAKEDKKAEAKEVKAEAKEVKAEVKADVPKEDRNKDRSNGNKNKGWFRKEDKKEVEDAE